MEIGTAEITSIIKKQIEDYDKGVTVEEIGTVLSTGDGIARIYGLDNAAAGELLEFPNEVFGMALNLEEDNVGAALFGESHLIKEGDRVNRTGRIVEVPVGDALRGRVVSPLGEPIDGRGPIETTERRRIELKAPGIVQRQPVMQPLQTGPQGHRLHDPHRPGPAGADHRRPPDRQDRGLPRHHHQPEGRRRHLHLCRRGPEALHRGPSGGPAQAVRRHGLHHRGGSHGLGVGAAPVHRALQRLHHGRAHPRQRRPRPGHLRRPLQARGGLPAALPACCAARRAARPFRATSSTCIPGCWSARPR